MDFRKLFQSASPEEPSIVPPSAVFQTLRRRRKQADTEGKAVERERRYICSQELVYEMLDQSQCTRQHITQSYFPKSFGKLLLPLASELHLISSDFLDLQVSQIRIRLSVAEDGDERSELTVKGRSPHLSPTERIELPITIRRDTYEALLPFASQGTVTKERLTLPFSVFGTGVDGKRIAEHTALEVDLPLERYIDSDDRENLAELQLALLEIETATRAVDRAVRDGLHGLPIVHAALDISADLEERSRLRKLCSWSRLARKGLSEEKLQRELEEHDVELFS